MICDEDPLRRRPRESTARRKRQERCVWMARKMTEWPSKRGPITKIMPSDGCIGDTVPLAVGKWYDFHEFGWYMGNVGLMICDEDPLRRRPRESTARRKRQERCVWMARKMTEWPSKRGPITKIMPSDGCIGDTVPLAVGKWYDFHEFGWYMGNVGLTNSTDPN